VGRFPRTRSSLNTINSGASGVALSARSALSRRVTGRRRTGERNRKLLPVPSGRENGNRNFGASADRYRNTILVFRIAALSSKVVRQPAGGLFQPLRIELWQLSIKKVFEQLRAYVTIEKNVLEFVLEAPQASITGGIAVLGAGFPQLQGPLAEFDPAFCLTASTGCVPSASATLEKTLAKDDEGFVWSFGVWRRPIE